MVNTVIFDIGNVLVDFRWQGLYEDLGFTGEKFEKIACVGIGWRNDVKPCSLRKQTRSRQ